MASHFFTSRFGGVSAIPYQENNLASHVGDDPISVAQNRFRLKAKVGEVVFMNQTHGETIVLIEGYSPLEPNADAMITQEVGIHLGVLTADCIPLLLWDENSCCVAAVHVGRKGLVNDVTVKTIDIMRSLGSEGIHGILGPSICGMCYEVGRDIYDEVVRLYPTASSRTNSGTLSLDLPAALSERLSEYGVSLERMNSCTVEDASFFSYRRDGVTGRFAGLISL